MATIKEAKKEFRYRKWAEEIAECQSSGMKIKEWCRLKGISCNTYYRRLRVVRTALLEQTANTIQPIVPLNSSAALQLARVMNARIPFTLLRLIRLYPSFVVVSFQQFFHLFCLL